MPLYDYRCAACGLEVEVMHGIEAPGPEACATCGGPMNKVLSPPAIHFKGRGWAKKDAAAASATKAKPKAGSAVDGDSSSTPGEDLAKGKAAGEGGTPAAAGKAEAPTSTSTTPD